MIGKVLAFRRVEGRVEDLSDEALLAACGTGDTAALAALFDRFQDSVHRFLSRTAHDSEIDDLVQTTFLEVRRSARSFGGRTTVRGWILGVAANVSRHHVRGEVRRRHALTSLSEVPEPEVRRPDRDAEQAQMMERLQEALEQLPEIQREAFVLCDLEGLPGVEAARVVGVREGTLWRRLHDARVALRAALEGGAP